MCILGSKTANKWCPTITGTCGCDDQSVGECEASAPVNIRLREARSEYSRHGTIPQLSQIDR